jgi:hypothetical protein
MNRSILKLLLDYLRRTSGVWALVVVVQMMQMSTIWVLGSRHVPIIGAVIAALAFRATWDSPHLVMRTLPIKVRELALLRWWECIGAPLPFIVLGLVLAWPANVGSAFPTPPVLDLWIPIVESVAALAILAVLPLPMLSAARSNIPTFVVFWMALLIGGIYGVPIEWFSQPLPALLLTCGCLLALASFGLARAGRVLCIPSLSRLFPLLDRWRGNLPALGAHVSGWPVLLLEWMYTILVLALASIVVISIVRPHVHLLQQTLPWIFVSATGAIGSILARRWLRSVPALQCLPIRRSTLALIVCLALMAPVSLTSVLATAVDALVPGWGVSIPLYMVPMFAFVPAMQISWYSAQTSEPVASSVQQWSPLMQVIVWPLWTGGFMSLGLAHVLPRWFELIAVGSAAVLALIAYATVLRRIRSGVGLERLGDPLTPR